MSDTNIYEKNNINDYLILETLGEGTFGKVKLAIHKQTNQEVAIKIFEKKNFISSKDLLYFKNEISILKKLNHPNIIRIYNIIEDDLNYYIIMEYASKGELFKYIVDKKRLNEKEAAYFYCQLIYGLEFIHKNGISHRDLKPENLLIKENNILTIIDFGLSHEYNSNTLLYTPCGSPSYAAPEMILGKKYNGLNIDIWSTGIILYAMVCGYLPFKDKIQEKLYKKILTCNFDLPSFLSDNCKDLIKKILCNEKNRININEIKKHPFLIDSFNKYNPNDYILYNSNKIYNKIIEIMVNNLSFNKNEIINSIKNKEFNNITTTYELLMKKIYFKENEKKQNFLFTKSSTDSCVTTNNVSNIINKCVYTLDERKKKNNTILDKIKNNNESKKEIKKLNIDTNQGSLSLSIQTKINKNNIVNDNNKIYSYNTNTQTNQQKTINNKNKEKKQLYEKIIYKNKNTNNEKYNYEDIKIDNNNVFQKNKNNTFKKVLDLDNFSTLNSNSSKEIIKIKKDIDNKSEDKTNTIKICNTYEKNLKIFSNELGDIYSHNQNIYSNDICSFNISAINEFIHENKNKQMKLKKFQNVLFERSKNKNKKNKKNINYFENYLIKNHRINKTELNNSNISNDNNNKLNSNNKINNNLNKVKKQRICRNYNTEGKNNSNINQNSLILNNTQSNKVTKQNFLKINNFKDKKKFTTRCSPIPPCIYLKINTEQIQNNKYLNNKMKNPTTRNKSKSMNKKLFFNNSSKKIINTDNLFSKNNNIKINRKKNKKKNNNKNKSNPKTYYSIYIQKSKIESSNIIKTNKKPKNCDRKNSNSLAFNPFNINNNHSYNKNSINSNINNNINLSVNSNSNIKNIPSKNTIKSIKEKKLTKIKTLSDKTIKHFYKNELEKKDQSLSNKNIIKFKTDEIKYYNNILKRNIYNNIKNNNNDSFYSETHIYKYKKNNDKYSNKTYDSNSNDFAVCNTNSSLEEINKKIIELSKNKNFTLTQIDLTNYICSKNKKNSIKIEISSKGKNNMLKIFYLEGKENITKDLIKNIIFSIGF